ncbi:bacteriochlorophyll 4-vinyl reductase [Thiorhodococcus mannitoliphagus]|uniref:Bacteriochlorophyll 4-vinyl reductase n=1 Tax=Thiorhodococcus mannitoliphagus TaxID=329406 RepID=A0A6P1DNZ8_9GAMM|nr:bacteriochlorophyll 4-vinyl reductase [Thiorhodococcus mannitoliphagus]
MALQGVDVSEKSNHGRVGPNAIIRVFEALTAHSGAGDAEAVFKAAGLEAYLKAMPTEMVDESEVIALQGALRQHLGVTDARLIARDAGLRTGDYLLANRIPRPAQVLLKLLPPKLAAKTLLKAIRGNAWTFVGTGVFDADPAYPPRINIQNSLLCRGASSDQALCDFYAGTFERLFRELVHAQAQVTETACHAMGAPSCVFEVRWSI